MGVFKKIKLNGTTFDLSGADILDKVYPVGSIYMSANDTNPQTFIGGTWVRLENRFLIGASASHAAGSTGGAESVTLTVDNMPSHTHGSGTLVASGGEHNHYYHTAPKGNLSESYDNYASQINGEGINITLGGGSHEHTITGRTGSNGSGTAVDTMPPYIAVYMWRRTE